MAPGKGLGAASGAWTVFEDEAGFSMTPLRAPPGAEAGRPLIRVRGRSRRRTPARAVLLQPGEKRAVSSPGPARISCSRAHTRASPGRIAAASCAAQSSSAARSRRSGTTVRLEVCRWERTPDPWDNWPPCPAQHPFGRRAEAV